MINNPLTELLNKKKKNLLNIYFTAGFPQLEDTNKILQTIENSQKVDIVEIGIPYSDPVADGETIQESSKIALNNGMTLSLLFNQLSKNSYKIPIVLMGYFNTIYVYGIEEFCKQCQKNNISGVIFPDLPIEVFIKEYLTLFNTYNISVIFLISPKTSKERLELITQNTSSFIYAVSSASTTGSKELNKNELTYLDSIQTEAPILVGFNIKNKNDLQNVFNYAHGGIIGSAFIKALNENTSETIEQKTITFLEKLN